jgi:hypothetical protein
VSESESITSQPSDDNVSSPGADDFLPRRESRTSSDREGLPRSYRMRADSHYVDELGAQPVIRLLAPGQIECRDLPPAEGLDALTRSIAAHGMLQPLLLRKQGGRHILVAGRKRLAAAIAAAVKAVPCLVHEIAAAGADALAIADNIRFDGSAVEPMLEPAQDDPVLAALNDDLAALRTSTALLRAGRQGAIPQKVGVDMIEAQAARAAWLASCAQGNFAHTRSTTLASIVQRVADEFEAQATLSGLHLECSVTPAASVWKLPEDALAAVIAGGVFSALALVDGVSGPRVEIHADVSPARTLKIEVVQRSVRVHPKIGDYLSEVEFVRAADLIPALALRLARTIAVPYGGSAEINALPGAGSVLQVTFATAHTA